MKIDFVSIFPGMFASYFGESMMKRAAARRLISVRAHDLRRWATGRHKKVDDKPYGGGPGMVMMAEPFAKAITALANSKFQKLNPKQKSKSKISKSKTRIILMSAAGKTFAHKDAVRLAKYEQLIFLCPRYEGVDARVSRLVDEEISIGDYVLTGGELPAMVVADAVARHIPGVLGKAESLFEESHAEKGVTEYPQYTRPETWRKIKVPAVLLSGDHRKIADWRKGKMKPQHEHD